MSVLLPMTQAQFERYRETEIASYANENIRSGDWSAQEAVERSRTEMDELLPAGLATPDHHLFNIVSPANGEVVGALWLAIIERAAERLAFVYDVQIEAAHRRQGHARRAFGELEERSLALDAHCIELHVFVHNQPARTLYAGLGFLGERAILRKALHRESG